MAMVETARTIYDTHAAVRRLREAGLPEPHAEAVVREQVHLIEHDLATKADIAAVQGNTEAVKVDLKADIEALKAELKADIEKLRLETQADIAKVQGSIEATKAELKADIEKLRLETRAEIAKVQGNIEAAKADLVKWMVGTNIGVGALIVAALQLL